MVGADFFVIKMLELLGFGVPVEGFKDKNNHVLKMFDWPLFSGVDQKNIFANHKKVFNALNRCVEKKFLDWQQGFIP